MHSFPQLKEKFEMYLERHRFSKTPENLYKPIDYIMQLGGKRIRPCMALAAANVFSDEIKEASHIAMAIEVFHNFSLVHDDIMDEAPLRRGKPSVHTKYDLNTAILSGDLMNILSYHFLLQSKSPRLLEVIRTFTTVATAVCEGQQMDMDFETQEKVSIPDYIQMIEGKTATLIAGAMKMGALVSGALEEDAGHLYEFGKNLGISFQIQDDILDTFGDMEKVGKKSGGDILQGKKTYLYLKTKELLDANARKEFCGIYASQNLPEKAKLSRIKEYFEETNAKGYAEELMLAYYQLALSHLQAVNVPDDRKATLQAFAKNLFVRDF